MKNLFTKLELSLKFRWWLVVLLSVLGVQSALGAYQMSLYRNNSSGATQWNKIFYFTQYSGNEYIATIQIPASEYAGHSTSDYQFWIGNGGWDGKSANVSLSSYLSSSNGYFTAKIWIDSSSSNYYPHDFTNMLTFSTDKDEYYLQDVAVITAVGGGSSYSWSYSEDNGATYISMSETTATISHKLMSNTIFRCTSGSISGTLPLELAVKCNSGSEVLFYEGFGTLSSQTARAQLTSSQGSTPYHYMAACTAMKNAGDYAIVANPKWAGCGDQAEGDNSCSCGGSFWFRDATSHGGDANGGMLMFNCGDGTTTTDLLYEKGVSIECAETLLTIELWVQAAWDPSRGNDPIDTKFILTNSSKQEILSHEINDLDVTQGWTKIKHTFSVPVVGTVYLQFVNMTKAGNTGNDLLIDDISIYSCRPDAYLSVDSSLNPTKDENNNLTVGIVAPYNNGSHYDTVELEAIFNSSTISNPYYYWVKSTDGGSTWNVVMEGSQKYAGYGDTYKTYTVKSTDAAYYKVAIAANETAAINILNGSTDVCGTATVTNYVNVEARNIALKLTLESDLCKGTEATYKVKLTNPFEYDIDNIGVNFTAGTGGAYSSSRVSGASSYTKYSDTNYDVVFSNLPANGSVSFYYYATPTEWTEGLQNTARSFIKYIRNQKSSGCTAATCMWNANYSSTPTASRGAVTKTILETCDDISMTVGASELRTCYGSSDYFDITLKNNGTKASNPTGIQMTINPSNLDVTCSGTGFSYDSSTGIISSTSIPAGATRYCRVTVVPQTMDAGSIDLQLTTDHTKTASVPYTIEACLPTVSVSALHDDVCFGIQGKQFTVTIENEYGFPLNNIIVGVELSPNINTALGFDPSTGTYDASTGRWSIPTLASGVIATLDISYVAKDPGISVVKAWIYDCFNLGLNYSYDTSYPYSKGSASQVVFNQLNATIEITGASTICTGSSSEITITPTSGTAPFTIRYSDGLSTNTLTNVTGARAITVSPASTTTYSIVSISDNNECQRTFSSGAEVTINVDPKPVGNAGTLDPQCNNGTFQLDGTLVTGAGLWTASSPVSISDATSPTTTVSNVPLLGDVELTWTVSNGVCAPVSSSVHAVNNDCTDLTVVVGDVSNICAGGDLNYNITVTNGNADVANNVVVTYTKPDGTSASRTFTSIASGASEVIYDTYSAPASTVSSSKSISVTAQKSGGVVVSDTKNFTVNPLPANQTITASATSYCVGSNVTLGLAGSQNDVTYTLIRSDLTPAATVPGTGSAFVFPGTYTKDTYTVHAEYYATSCQADMPGTMEITENPLPRVSVDTRSNTQCLAPFNGEYTINGLDGTAPYMYSNDGGANYSATATYSGFETASIEARVKDNNGCESEVENVEITNSAVTPTQFNVIASATEYCAVDATSGVNITLSGSENGFRYQLIKNGTVVKTLPGEGGALDFGTVQAGTYKVYATNESTKCGDYMRGEITVTDNPLPTATVNVTNNTRCVPDYNGAYTIEPAGGSGSGYTFSINGGEYSSVNGKTKQQNATDVVTVKDSKGCISVEYPAVIFDAPVRLQSFAMTTTVPSNEYCEGTAGVELGLDGSELNVDYTISEASGAFAPVTVSGTGSAITFGAQKKGSYTVHAVNVITGCEADMTGEITVRENQKPSVSAIVSHNDRCTDPFNGSYELQASAGSGSYLYSVDNGSTYSAKYIYENLAQADVYARVKDSKGCVSDAYHVIVNNNAIPLTRYELLSEEGKSTYCSNEDGVALSLNGSEDGVVYTLYKDGSSVADFSGSGSAIDFGKRTDGVYTVTAANTLTGCTADMNGTITIHVKPAPTAGSEVTNNTRCLVPYNGSYTILASGGSGSGYTYSNNNGLSFGNQFFWDEVDSADFYAKVKDGDGCISNPHRVIVENKASDMTVYNIQTAAGATTYCANTEGVEILLSGSQDGAEFIYSLINVTTGATVVEKTGNGSAISFGKQKSGEYRIAARNTNTGCTTDMNGRVTLTENKVPSATISGSTTVCEGTGTSLDINVTDYFSSYVVTYKKASDGSEAETRAAAINVNPAATETYNIVKVEDENGCARTYSAPFASDQTATVTVDVTPVSAAGNIQVQYNNGTFTLEANEPRSGETGEWRIVSVTPSTAARPSITNINKNNTTVTGVEVGSSVDLMWTVSSALGECSPASSTVTISNVDGTNMTLLSQFENGSYCADDEPKLTITLTNSAPRDAANVVVTNAITKASIKAASVTVSTGTYNYATNVWSVGDLNQGAVATLTARAIPTSTTTDATIEDKAYVSSANGIDYASYEAAPAGMKTTATTTVHAVPELVDADVTVVNNTSCDDTAPTGSITVKDGFYEYSFDGGLTWGASNKLTGLKNGTYSIKVRSQYGCVSNAIPATVRNNAVQPIKHIVSTTNDGEYCEGSTSDVHIKLAGSQTEFNYQLYKDNSTTSAPQLEPVGNPVHGTGSELDFGAFEKGKYYVKAISTISETCDAFMNDVAVEIIENKLQSFNIQTAAGATAYCANTDGIEILLSGSENGAEFIYSLINVTTGATVVEKPGTGSAISFGKQKAGEYRVAVRNTVTTCAKDMDGRVTLTENKVPSATISGSTTICNGSGTSLDINVTDYFSSYVVTYKKASDGSEAETSDAAINVTPTATETYNIVKVEDENGCVRTYSAPFASDQTATVTVDETPNSEAGNIQVQYNNGTFTMDAVAPRSGETGEWSIVSVIPSTAARPSITNINKNNTTVTGVEVGSSVELMWTVSSALRVCSSASSTVTISNVDGTDLGITSQFDLRAYCADEEPQLTLTLTNTASRVASDVVVSNAITKASIKAGSATASSGSYDYTTNVWTVGDMVPGGTATLTLKAVPSSTTQDATIEDKAYVSSANGIDYASYDAAPASMKTTATTTAHAVPELTDADVTVVDNTSCDDNALTGSITVKAGFHEYSFDGGQTWGTSNKLTGLKDGTYYIKVRSQYECESVTITAKVENKSVQPVIQRVTTTNDGEYCEGTTSDVHIKVAGSQTEFKYQLYKDNSTSAQPRLEPVGNAIPGTGSELDFGAFEAGKYYVKAISTISETCDAFMNDNAVVITENPKPTMTYKVIDKATGTEIIAPYVITCSIPEMEIQLSGADGYAWRDGSTAATRTVTEEFRQSVYPVSDKGCEGEIVEIEITVNKETPKDVVIASEPADADLTLTCKNQEITLTASSTTANVTYKWNDAAQTEGAVLRVSDISTQATYKVTVTAANGCTSESDVTIKENKTKPVVSVDSKDETGADNTLLNCTHPELTLKASVSNTQIVGNCTYEWSTLSQTSYSTDNPLTVTSANVYSVVATGENGCASDKVEKEIKEDFRKPVAGIIAPTDTLTCNPLTNTIVLKATSDIAGSTFVWNTQETTEQITVAPDPQHADRTFSVVATAPNGCSSENVAEQSIADKTAIPSIEITPSATIVTCEDVTLTASCESCQAPEDRIVRYKWNDVSFTEGDVLVINKKGTYTVTATNRFECVATETLDIDEDKTAPVIEITPDGGTLTCAEPELTVTVVEKSGLRDVSYVWTDDQSESAVRVFTRPDIYTVVATNNATKCTTEASVEIKQNTKFPSLNVVALESVCMPATVDISKAVASSSVYDDIFYYDAPGSTVPMASTVVDVDETTTYYVQAVGVDGSGCASEIMPIVVAARRLADTPTVVPYDECPVPGKKSMRDLVTSDKTNLKFYDSIEGGSEVSDMFDAATENSDYTYYVSNTTKDQCESERAEINIHVDGTIDYDLIASAAEVIATQDEVTISVIPTKDTQIEKYSWTKNGNAFPSDSDEITDILYTNSEFAVNASGRCNSITKKVTVRALWPTVIVPDGPGKNGEFARGCNITVFNRFNEKVFEGNDGWDGTLNCALAKKGVKADPGVYYYYIVIPDGSTQKGIIEVVKF